MKMKPTARLTLIAFLLFMARGMSGPISSVVWRSLGASYLVIGLLGTVGSLTAIVANPLWGRASDRLGQRRVFLIGGVGVLALATVSVALVPSYAWLFPVLIVTSLAQAAYGMASLALMGDWLEHEAANRPDSGSRGTAGRRMGTYRGLASLGFGLMAFVSGTIADRLSLRAPFVIGAVFLALAFVLALRLREPASEGDVEDKEELRPGVAAGLSSLPESASEGGSGLPLAPLMVAALLWSLSFGAVYSVWGNYMVEGIGYSAAQMTRLWAIASLSEFPLMILAGWLSDRVGRLPMLAVGFVAWALVFVGYLVVPTMPWIVLVQLVRGFAFSAHTATALTYAAEVRKRSERGRISGLYGTAGGLGSILGSSFGGATAEFIGFRALIGAGAGMIFGGALYLGSAAIRYGRSQRRRALPPSSESM
jgi:MFS family permease